MHVRHRHNNCSASIFYILAHISNATKEKTQHNTAAQGRSVGRCQLLNPGAPELCGFICLQVPGGDLLRILILLEGPADGTSLSYLRLFKLMSFKKQARCALAPIYMNS